MSAEKKTPSDCAGEGSGAFEFIIFSALIAAWRSTNASGDYMVFRPNDFAVLS
jgi:hypothetical protein